MLNPFPDHRDIYLLVAGLVLGVLLGPAVLGQLAPTVYDRLFVGSGPATVELREAEAEHEAAIRQLEALGDAGPTPEVAIPEHRAAFEQQRVLLQAQAEQERSEHFARLTGRLMALVLAVIGTMVIEALVSPQAEAGKRTAVPAALSRLVTIRYALTALWLALAIAQPALLGQVAMLFAALLIAVALAAAFVPLGRKAEPVG